MDPTHLHRRDFVKLGTLAASASLLGVTSVEAASTPVALPPLGYAFDALEPHIDAKTMEIHHDKHHQAYVDNLNKALATDAEAAKKPLDDLLADLSSVKDDATRTAIRNNGGGHWNHSFFWATLAPAASSGKPSDDLTAGINKSFGSMEAFKKAFGEAATKRFGSGWAWLIVNKDGLKIVSTPNQDSPLMKGTVPEADLGMPLLGLDVWEHAYYLHYQNRRADYIAAWWNIVNWKAVSDRYAQV